LTENDSASARKAEFDMDASQARRRVQDSRFWQAYGRRRYAILFYALLLTLLVMPVIATFGLPQTLIKILLAGCLLAAVMPNATRGTRAMLFSAVLLLFIVKSASDRGYLHVNPGLSMALVGVIGLAAAAGTLRFAVQAKTVNSETLYASLSTYLLAGVFFGQIYWSLEQVWPGSIVGPDKTTELTCVYYSFVTLATLGYGDFLPRTDIARGVATFEVIGGQLFLAVMVARLIGLFSEPQPNK
jgi:Ion channel